MIRTLLMIGVIVAVLAGPAAVMAADQCQEVTATNRQHVNAGRAHQVSGSGCDTASGYYAVGSEEYLGSSATARTTLFTTDDGQSYHLGNCPAGVDGDNDGYTVDVDCNDADPAIHPQATEICGDGIDQDCDGSDLPCTANCQEYTTTNDAHVAANRAYTITISSGCDKTVSYFALGGDEALGNSGSTVTTLHSQDGGKTYRLGSCPAAGEDIDGDGYLSEQDCDDYDANIHPGATDFCGDGIDQDCSGADTACLAPPSCIPSLDNWKVKYAPHSSDCKTCHTRCTYGGLEGWHNCIEGDGWGAQNCKSCHGNVHD